MRPRYVTASRGAMPFFSTRGGGKVNKKEKLGRKNRRKKRGGRADAQHRHLRAEKLKLNGRF